MTFFRRRWRTLAWSLVALAASSVAFLYAHKALDQRRLAAVVARLDADDPGWRLEDMEAARRAGAADMAPALAAIAVDDTPLGDGLARQRLVGGLLPPVRLTPTQLQYFQAAGAANDTWLKPALGLTGRHSVTPSADVVSTRLDHVGRLAFVDLLVFEPAFYLALERDDTATAVQICRGEWNLGRTLRGEPWLASQRNAVYFSRTAVGWCEVLLARLELPDADLAAIQGDLADTLADDPWATSVRGQRGYFDAAIEAVGRGDLTPLGARAAVRRRPTPSAADKVRGWLEDEFGVYSARSHAAGLELMTRLVATERLPWPDRLAAVDSIRTDIDGSPELVRRLNPDFRKHLCKLLDNRLQMSSAIAAVAAERYRAANGRWPTSLDALVPQYLTAVPIDPVGGRPLAIQLNSDGIAVGAADTSGRRVEFRLWDVPQRNRPPAGDGP